MTTIPVTPAIRAALTILREAEAAFRPGEDSYARIEIPKLQLADAVLAAIAAQERAEGLTP